MRPVAKDEFYAAVGQLDVEVSLRGRSTDDDYGTDFHLKSSRALVGRTRRVGDTPHYKPDTEYFIRTGGASDE